MDNISVSLNSVKTHPVWTIQTARNSPGIYTTGKSNYISFNDRIYELSSDNKIGTSEYILGEFKSKIAGEYTIDQNGIVSFKVDNECLDCHFREFPVGSIIEWRVYPNDLFMVIDCGPNLVNLKSGVQYHPDLPQKFRLVGNLDVKKS